MEDKKNMAAKLYLETLDHLDFLILNRANKTVIANVRIEESKRWKEVKKLMPGAFCRQIILKIIKLSIYQNV